MREAVLGHVEAYPQSLLVVEEYDKADCATRALLRQLLDHGATAAGSSFRRHATARPRRLRRPHTAQIWPL